MNNKTINQSQTFEDKNIVSCQLEHMGKKGCQKYTQRIFPPMSLLFQGKTDHSLSQKKITHATLNSFKPKLERRPLRQFTTVSKKQRIKTKQYQFDIKQTLIGNESTEQKLEKLREAQLEQIKQQHKNKIIARPTEQRRYSRDPFAIKNSTNYETCQSPYAKYSTNCFPKKEIKGQLSKNKVYYNTKHQYISELGSKLKNIMSEKLQNIDARISQMTNKNVLQVMTIFSIKQQKHPLIKHEFIRKKPLFKTLAPQKQGTSRYKKKIYRQNQVQIDTNTDKIYFRKIYSYICFLNKVKYSNNLPITNVNLNERYNGEKIKVFVGNGNNKYLIIALLKRRFWYQITNKITKDTKFVWTQNSIRDVHAIQKNSKNNYKKAQQIKHQMIEQYDALHTQVQVNSINPEQSQQNLYNSYISAALIKNGSTNLQNVSVDIDAHPLKAKLKIKNTKSQKKQHNKKIFLDQKKAENAQKMLQRFKINTKPKTLDYNIDAIQTITNHIPHNSFIGSKKALFYTMQHYYRNIKNIDPFTIIPKTYHFKSLDDEAYQNFLQQQKQINEKSIWIVKPGECTNRGNGIFLMKAADVSRKLLKKQFHENGQLKTTIVQSYITDPLLYNGRKFDIRHYLMVTSVNGNLKAYWYSEGYLRTSSQYFTLQNLGNTYIHLTNDAIQKTSEKYGKYQPGNKLSYSEFQRYLDSAHTKKKINFRQQILPLMKQIATDVIKANYLNLDKDRKINNFQIFGMDFMIDSKFKPWLIQINANPCLQISCHLLSRIIPIMVQHSLRLGLDPLILPPSHYPPNNRYYLSDNFIENLRYEIIFDQQEECCLPKKGIELHYDFQFDEPQDQYQNQGAEIDLTKILD